MDEPLGSERFEGLPIEPRLGIEEPPVLRATRAGVLDRTGIWGQKDCRPGAAYDGL
jgi:hypothetical protein